MKHKKHDHRKADNDKESLRAAQIELVKLQREVIKSEQKVLVILEGRDAAGKDGTVKHIAQHLSPRETRIVALGVPSDLDRRSWYFQRYVAHLPAGGEIVIFNRSWYNRAGVERVMGYCSKGEYEQFLKTVPIFEDLLVHCGFTVLKYYLDITRAEQKKRLQDRRDDPLSQWKLSRVDQKALKHWDDYTDARDEMLLRTHSVFAPWTIVQADDKPRTHLNVIRDLLTRVEFDRDKDHRVDLPDPDVVFRFTEAAVHNGQLAR